MDTITEIIQSLGFPIACVVGLGYFCYVFVKRVQDENAAREEKYQTMLMEYGKSIADVSDKMADVSETMAGIANSIVEMRNDISDMKKYVDNSTQK